MASVDILSDFAVNVLPGGKGFITDAYYQNTCDVLLPKLRAGHRNYFARTGVAAIMFPATMMPPRLIGQDVEVTIGTKKAPICEGSGA